ncbi:hypothetical protein [Streptomyces sp. NPDC058664]|uniref:hypothetical protein n=1 Tax=unclassified Streptomyces TaxID=2593676 RepID=UPI0036479ACB
MRTALRTALATALVAGVAATPVLAAGSAFAGGPAPAPKPVAATAKPAVIAKPTSATEKPAVIAKPTSATEKPAEGEGAAEAEKPAPAEAAPAAAPTTATPGVPASRTVQLAGGLSAKVYARGDQHRYHTATVLKGGMALGELKAGAGYGAKDTEVFAGWAVTLDSEGNVSAVAKGTLVRTQTLISGTVAKIYKVGTLHHRAELFREGRQVGVLEAGNSSAAGNDNGEFFVLNGNGTTHNWTGNYRPGATPGIYRLADGTVLELAKKDGRYGLQLIENDKGRGFTYLNGVRQVWTYGKAVVVLENDGGFAAYVPGSAKQAAPQPYGMGGGGQGEPTPVDKDTLAPCTIARIVDIGAGTGAKLIMSPQGPKAKIITAGDNKLIGTLDRAHPALPKSAGIVARIVNPYTATPSLYTKVEGGTAKGATHAFPKLPKGCKLAPVKSATVGNGTGGTGVTVHAGQTSVIPQGGVAAGAEFGAEGDSTALVAAGAGAASLAAAGLGFVVLRRRSAARA